MGNSRKLKQQKKPKRSFPRLITPFPPRRTARMRYMHSVAIGGAAAGVGDFQVYSPSSLYDPDLTGVGHQPMYFDQLLTATGPYTRYLVTSVHIRIRCTNFSVASTPVVFIVYVSPNSTTPASIIQALEKPWSQVRELSIPSGGPCNASVVMHCPSHLALGISRQHLLTDEYYAGLYNANPAVNWFLTLCVYGVSNPCSLHCIVELDMDCILYSLGNASTS